MQFLYVLGTGSRWDNNEIRYSLRSLEKNYFGPISVTVVGHKPDWLVDVQHITYIESPSDTPVANTTNKLRTALPYLENRFVHMNDDFYIMEPIRTIPVLHGGLMVGRVDQLKSRGQWKAGMYSQTFIDTYNLLRSIGIEKPLRYDIHSPFPMERDKVAELYSRFDLSKLRLKTMYGNINSIGGTRAKDIKLSSPRSGTTFYSSRNVVPAATADFLAKRFPEPSRFEL